MSVKGMDDVIKHGINAVKFFKDNSLIKMIIFPPIYSSVNVFVI